MRKLHYIILYVKFSMILLVCKFLYDMHIYYACFVQYIIYEIDFDIVVHVLHNAMIHLLF